MSSSSNSKPSRLPKWMRHPFGSRPQASQASYEEILYLSNRTQSLDELLTLFPQRISTSLDLSSFHIFLREKNSYVQRTASPQCEMPVSFPASCSTVSRMKRDRKPAVFVPEGTPDARPDGWQLLAEPYEIAALTSLGVQLLLPLEGRTGLMGFATLARHDRLPFTATEIRFLRDLGPEMGHGLETAQLVKSMSEQAIERARVHRELEVAREVQERLLPDKLPMIFGIDASAAYRSAEQVGGDYYDLFATPGGCVCAVVADISGKGVPAALLMAALRASLHALMLDDGLPITTLIERLNKLLYKASSASRYATLFLCIYDPDKQCLTYVNAGHNPPILIHEDGSLRSLDCGGTVVGLLPFATYEAETIQLTTGDTLIAYTDGVSEAFNPQGEEWGADGLEAAALQSITETHITSRQLVESILKKLDTFVSGAAQADDITLVVFRKRESEAS